MASHHQPDPQPPVDVRVVCIQSAALRLENLLAQEVFKSDPVLTAQIDIMAQRLRREMNVLKLTQQTPGL